MKVLVAGGGTDTCHTKAGSSYPGPPFTSVAGGVWNVGYVGMYQKNTWGWDSIGWTDASINWFRTNIPTLLPCQTTIHQEMKIVVNGASNGSVVYKANAIVVQVGTTSLAVTRNGVTQNK